MKSLNTLVIVVQFKTERFWVTKQSWFTRNFREENCQREGKRNWEGHILVRM